jgi:hypothetical protein
MQVIDDNQIAIVALIAAFYGFCIGLGIGGMILCL